MVEFKFILAPLEDYTDSAFRTLCYNLGCDLTFTEMARVDGLARNNKSTMTRIQIQDHTPTEIQLLGPKIESLNKFLGSFQPENGFCGFNLNLGCPSSDMVRIGQGCAMIKRVSKVNELIKIIKDKGYSCSVKLRLGMNQYEKDKKVYLNLIENTNADYYIVHARHGKQSYNEPADFSVYDGCVKTGKVIIANGDIKTKEQIDNLKIKGVRGVMIGRAAINNPAIFSQLKNNKSSPFDIKKEYLVLADMYGSDEIHRKNVVKFIGR